MGKHDDRPQGCSCHTCAPCSFCTSLTEEEADIAWNGGSDAVWAYRRQKETEEAERHLAIRELDEMTPHMKHLMENQLSVREAKVVAVMARTGATSPKEIGKAARIWQSNKERKDIITFLPRAEEPKGDEDVEDSLSNGFGDGQTGLRVPRGTQERQVERGRSPWDPGFEEVFHGEATGDPASKIVCREVPRQEDEGISGGGLNGETDLDRV
jgi:hypothetical protein